MLPYIASPWILWVMIYHDSYPNDTKHEHPMIIPCRPRQVFAIQMAERSWKNSTGFTMVYRKTW